MVADNAKAALIDIIKHAYPRSSKIRDYCNFNFFLLDRELKSKHGDYFGPERRIRIFNIKSRELVPLITTSIHELAHHIDYCNRGTSDHSSLFYEEYRTLIFAALDMDMISINDVLESRRDASDSVKLKLMVIEYLEEGREKREKVKRAERVCVYDAYDIKDTLKASGYRWDASSRAWSRELSDDGEQVIASLEDIIRKSGKNITYELKDPPRFDAPPELPDSYCFHDFTEEEKALLNAGEEIYIPKCWSRKKALFFSCHLSWDGEQLVPRYGD